MNRNGSEIDEHRRECPDCEGFFCGNRPRRQARATRLSAKEHSNRATSRAGYFARPHDFQSIADADAAVGKLLCSPAGVKINDASRVSGEHRVPAGHSAPSALQHRCRTQGDRLSYEGRASWPAGLVFQLPLDLDIARNLGGDGWVLRDFSGPLEGGGVP
jgi:hypothetical protein